MTQGKENGATTSFGRLPSGEEIHCVEIGNEAGLRARVITYGAALQALVLPDGADVVLGHATLQPYLDHPAYLGAIVGRYANRIGGGAFTLDGERYAVTQSDGANTLHGGARGFDKRVWSIAQAPTANRVSLTYVSADGEEGFPGTVSARTTYEVSADNVLQITLEAMTDRSTVVCMSGHGYFNLAGEGSGESVLGHEIEIAADAITPVDSSLIPTGELQAVENGPFDFRRPYAIGTRIGEQDVQLARAGGYDHNFVLRKGRGSKAEFAARLRDPKSGRVMEILTTEPGLQFYSGNFLSGASQGKTGATYGKHAGLCLEPQVFPDAPNKPQFPSARLDPGQAYRHVTHYRFV